MTPPRKVPVLAFTCEVHKRVTAIFILSDSLTLTKSAQQSLALYFSEPPSSPYGIANVSATLRTIQISIPASFGKTHLQRLSSREILLSPISLTFRHRAVVSSCTISEDVLLRATKQSHARRYRSSHRQPLHGRIREHHHASPVALSAELALMTRILEVN